MDVTVHPGRLSGTIPAIPSKSAAHRLLILAALADGKTDIACPAVSKDILATANCLAALGAEIEVPTLEGRVQINLPGNSNSGRGFRLRGKGLGPEGRRGDLIARIQVQMPQTSSAEEVELWKKLASCSSFRPRQGR